MNQSQILLWSGLASFIRLNLSLESSRGSKLMRIIFLFLCSTVWAQVNTLGLIQSKSQGFGGHLGLNFEGARGNNNYLKYGLASRVDFVQTRAHHFMVGEYQLGQSGKSFDTYLRKGFVHARSLWRIHPWVSPEIFTQSEINDGQKLRFRRLLGAGLRNESFNMQKDSFQLALSTGTGLMFEVEKYVAAKQEYNFERWRSSNYLSFEFKLQPQIFVSLGAFYQPNLAQIEDYRMLLNTKISLQIWKNIKLIQKFNSRYDHLPYDPQIESWDFDMSSGMEIEY